jgi:subtilisin family serine protease
MLLMDKGTRKTSLISLMLVAVFLVADLSAFATPSTSDSVTYDADFTSPILVEGLPPLMCGEDLCLRPLRDIDRGERPSSEAVEWWQSYGPDLDWNGMDDRLQRVLAGAESVSPTAVVGDDGKKTVAIVVDYAWHPTVSEIETLRVVLEAHGWIGEENGAWFQVLDDIDSVAVDKVPVSALMDIYASYGVVVIEMQNVMIPFNDIAAKAARSRPSDVYTQTAYERDYTGEGVVVAVLDTGVDNEHEALNDFDDIDDEPDEDAGSYDDQKWVAGYDATSSAGATDGTQDPDDGNGHGTHVAGSVVGTGDASRLHMGTAPGAYLVDVKVLTDTGGTNSQASLNGIQWVINNANTDWGNNASSRGIQVASMSFGSASSPLNPGDQGDNGSGAEARLVNDAVNASIVCVVAMGNDGTNRVPSPASADQAISVGAATDRGTVNRTNDNVADYSNTGPRIDDGDEDEWDELKPDITSFGSGIMSATAATGTSFPGQPERPLAGNDYDEKDGTSMATPIASGVVATILQAEPSLSPQEVKDILRNSSEQRGSASEPSVSNRWNADWGFGLIDASCALDTALDRSCTPLEGGGTVAPPPSGNGTGDHVTVDQPINGSWWIEGDRERVSGVAEEGDDGPYDEVQVRIEQHLESGNIRELQGWVEAGGDVENWYLDVSVKSDWIRADEEYVFILARAVSDDGQESLLDARYVNLARMAVTLAGPSVGTLLVGSVDFSGTAEGLEHDRLEYKVDSGEWLLGEELEFLDVGTQDWSFGWNSNAVEDGSHRLSFRMVNESGVATDTVRRTYTVDNQPAAPDFVFQSSVEILDQGLPVYSAVAGTVLEIDFTIGNVGDLDATDVYVRLEAPGSSSETYPSETSVAILNEGESHQITLYWWATEPGQQEVSITVDPTSQHADPTPENNVYTFSFEVEERPVESMLRFLPGSVTTIPSIPNPGLDFTVRLRLDNLGQTDATSLDITLQNRIEGKWSTIGVDDILVVPGSDTSSGYAIATFSVMAINDVGAMEFKASVVGNGVEAEFSQHRFTITIDGVQLGAPVNLELSSGEVPVQFIGLEEGALIFTTIDGELHVRSINEKMNTQTDLLLEDMWGGELAVLERSDGFIHAAWTRKSISTDGYTLTDIGMTALSAVEMVTPVHYQMPAQKLSEGSYWGLALAEYDETLVLAGYHRDIKTEGSWQDVTSIFTLVSNNPDGPTSWGNPINVLSNIDIRASKGDALVIGYGVENLHILYQEMRNDVTGIDRVGLMYTHGEATLTSWSFQSSIGDDASNARLLVKQVDDEDVLIAAWIEGRGREAMVAHVVTGNSWSVDEPTLIEAPGSSRVELHSSDQGIQIVYDEINTFGPTTRYGLITNSEHESINGLSNLMVEGFLQGYAGMKDDGIVMLSSASGSLKLRTLASLNSEDSAVEDDRNLLTSLLAPLPGTPDEKRAIAGAIVLFLCIFLVSIVVSIRRGRLEEQAILVPTEIVGGDEESIELMIQPEHDQGPLLAIDVEAEELIVDSTAPTAVMDDEEPTLAESLEAQAEAGTGNARLNRRMQRKQQREMEAIAKSLPPLAPLNQNLPMPSELPPLPAPGELPPLPAPGELLPLPGLPPLPNIAPPQRDIVCPECSAKFVVKDMTLKRVSCPICSTKVQC